MSVPGTFPSRSSRPRSRGHRPRSGSRSRASGVFTAPAAEHACGREQRTGLQRAPLDVVLDPGVRVVALEPLHRLAARERQRGVGEHGDPARVCVRRQHRESTREEEVARRLGAELAVLLHAATWPRLTGAPSTRSSWTSVARSELTAAPPDTAYDRSRRRQERERRTQALAARGERVPARSGRPGLDARNGLEQVLLDEFEVRVEPRCGAQCLERARHRLAVVPVSVRHAAAHEVERHLSESNRRRPVLLLVQRVAFVEVSFDLMGGGVVALHTGTTASL